MKTIQFTDTELAELKNYYQNVLEKTIEKLDTVKGILDKIDTVEITEGNGKVSIPLTKASDHVEQIKPQNANTFLNKNEEKSKWMTFILDLLKQHNKPIKFAAIIDEAIKKFNIPNDNYNKVKESITNSTFRLRNIRKKIRNIKFGGEKGKFVGLSRWFDKNGELKEEYKERLALTAKRVGRKPQKSNSTDNKDESKPKWTTFVLDLLSRYNKPIKFDEIVTEAIHKFNIPSDKHETVKQSIINSAFRLRNIQKKIRSTIIKGERGKYLCLSAWFDKSGKLKEEYQTKLIPIVKNEPQKQRTTTKNGTGEKSNIPTWTEFVLETLKKEDRPIHARKLTDKAMAIFNIDKKLFEKTRISVARSMSRLEKEDKALKTFSKPGVLGKYYGLAEWFDNNGELNTAHFEKIEHAN